jgi:hypothetical protein
VWRPRKIHGGIRVPTGKIDTSRVRFTIDRLNRGIEAGKLMGAGNSL